MERREFLRRTVVGAGAAALGTGLGRAAGQPKVERRNERPAMQYARLGRTNLRVSRIVHGSLFTNMQRLPLLERLMEGGVNYFDTAWLYGGGRSEEAFGAFFGQHGRRDKVFISSKVVIIRELKAGTGVYEAAMKQAETSLRRLKTDHVDIMMLHGSNTLLDAVENPEWLRAAEDLKKQGKARFIGFSEHAKPAEVLARAAASGKYDMAMVAFSLVKGKWGSLGRADIKAMEPAMAAAGKADMGIVVMKAAARANEIAAGTAEAKLKKPGFSIQQLCYRYVLGVPGVDAVVCGMTNMAHVEENLKVPAIDLAAGDVERFRDIAAASRVCGFCGTCLDACPNGIRVQDILRFHCYWGNGYRAAARAEYAALAPEQRVPACRDCGACEDACPMRVPIRLRLREAHHVLA